MAFVIEVVVESWAPHVMIDVSIIIVNYNVKQFLLQALDSIYKNQGVGFEVFVDNNSTDHSMDIKELFPSVQCIENKKTGIWQGKQSSIGQGKRKVHPIPKP